MLRIKALGCLVLVGHNGPVAGSAAQPKRLAFLALLARVGERGISREKVLGYFWPDAEDERARRSLANVVSALRRDLGDDLFDGGNQLRLNAAVLTSDVAEFDAAIRSGDLARAAHLYEGPFLEGFRLPGAPEFERWADSERTVLERAHVDAVEKLAAQAEAAGEFAEAVGWWRKVAATDPLNTRIALGLMRSLVAAGDPAGAVRHAQIHEALVDQELGLPPDAEVVAFASRLRATARTPPAVAPAVAAPVAPAVGQAVGPPVAQAASAHISNEARRAEEPVARAEPVAATSVGAHVASPPVSAPRSSATRTSWRKASWLGAAAAAVAAAFVVVDWARARGGSAADVSVIALGHIADYRRDRTDEVVKPLTDMLATSLARSSAMRVVSNARIYELASQGSTRAEGPTGDAFARAARAASARELIEGSLYALDDTTLRLDLRRVDLETGNVLVAHSVSAREPFALADSATVRLLADVGADAPPGSIAEVTTKSLAAYRFYDEGLRAFYQDDLVSAGRLFEAALAEDPTFASAAYYLALSYRQDEVAKSYPMLERAVALAARAPERERLIIRARWEQRTSSRALRATAESLLVRYPDEVQGHFFTGLVRVTDGEFLEAVPFLERVIAMDSLSLHGVRAQCMACEAFTWLSVAYELADSIPRAEREVRRWLALQPRSANAYAMLVEVLSRQERIDEAIAAWRERSRMAPGYEVGEDVVTRLMIQGGEFEKADELMRGVVATGSPARRTQAYWYRVLAARYQGRLNDALRYAREEQRARREAMPNGTPPGGGLSEGQVLQELGRGREAAAVFDAYARWNPGTMPKPDVVPGMIGRHRSWNLTHAATALASVGDTATLAARADTIQLYGARSLFRLHRELHHHVRGLLMAARHRDEEAIEEFRRALHSLSSGYTRTNYELGRALLRRGRPGEAIEVVGPALRSGIEATSYYVTRVELHELLAQAWDSLGAVAGRGVVLPSGLSRSAVRDSAVAHYRYVARAWERGDSAFARRARRAAARAQELTR